MSEQCYSKSILKSISKSNSTSKLQLHKGFKVSKKSCLNLCLFKWLKLRSNLSQVFNTYKVIDIEFRSFVGSYRRERFSFQN